MGLYSGGLIIGRIFASEIWEVYFREGLFLGELIIGILRFVMFKRGCITQKRSRRRLPFGLKAWFNDYAKQNNNNNTRRMFTDFMQIWNNR